MKTRKSKLKNHFSLIFEKLFEKLGQFNGAFISGGAIASYLLQEPINDYDVFFKSHKEWKKAVSLLFDLTSKEAQIDFKNWMKVFPEWKTDIEDWRGQDFSNLKTKAGIKIITKTMNAISFSLNDEQPPFHLINTYSGKIKKIIEKFDFVHTKVAVKPNGKVIWGKGNSIEFISKKKLKYNRRMNYSSNLIERLSKFQKRGWTVPKDSLIAFIIKNEKDLKRSLS
jgi:hypothetical protein